MFWCTVFVHKLKISLSQVAVRGVALLSNKLYVLRVGGRSADVAVYETESFTLERRLTVPGLRAACDMAASERSALLFIADRGCDVVHMVSDVKTLRPKWPRGQNFGLGLGLKHLASA